MDLEDIPREFYKNLGKLFYAIAFADVCVKKEEVFTLNTMIKKE